MAGVFGAIGFGLLGSFLAGWIGVALVVIFAAVAIIFRIKKNKADPEGPQKVSAIICGIVGVILAVITQIGVSAYATKMKDAATELGDVPMISAGADGFKTLGIMGFVSMASDARPSGLSDDAYTKEFEAQLNRVNDKINNK